MNALNHKTTKAAMNMERKEGYYWVKRVPGMNWEIAWWYPSRERWLIGTDSLHKDFFEVINETRIEPPNN